MGDLVDIAVRILALSERRIEVSGQNIANVATPGYKSRLSFESLLTQKSSNLDSKLGQLSGSEFSDGRMMGTGSPTDLALAGRGFFVLQSDKGPLFTRNGQFQRDATGRLVSSQGLVVQAQGADGLVLGSDDFNVLQDGTVLEQGQPVGRLAVVDFENLQTLTPVGDSAFSAPDDQAKAVDVPVVRQGMLEASNVSTATEMVRVMEALRRAEGGQRLVNVYDDLMGNVITALGRS